MALATSDQEYQNNPEHWGENAFVSLESIIDNIILTADDDSYFKHVKRFRASIFGKLGIKKLNVDIRPDRKAISRQLTASKVIPFPRYMTNWYRVSVVNECEKLEVLNINNNPAVVPYWNDDEGELFYSCDGEILTGDNYHPEYGDCCIQFECDDKDDECDCGCEESNYSDSWVKEDRKGSYFEFSDDLVGKEIVIEFLSAGLDTIKDCDIKVHHDMELTVMRFIQYNLLQGKRNVPDREWVNYYNQYKIEKKRSEKMLGDKISIQQILKSVSLRYQN